MSTVRIVNYALDDYGRGDATRLVGINRWLHRYCEALDLRAERYVLTTNESDAIFFNEGIASFKLPSYEFAKTTGIGQREYAAVAKQWVWNSLSLLRPDLLVVDAFPRGVMGELLSCLDLVRRKVFVYPAVKADHAQAPDFTAMLPLYDRILIAEPPDVVPALPREAAAKAVQLGPCAGRERAELWSALDAREHLGIAGNRVVVYVATGGATDGDGDELLLELVAPLLDNDRIHLVVNPGPLYRGRVFQGERISWLGQQNAAELAKAFDMALCAASYENFAELLHLGVPCIYVPSRGSPEARRRAELASAAGAAQILEPVNIRSSRVEQKVERWLDRDARASAAEAARRFIDRNHARDAAAAMLALDLDERTLARARALVNDDVLHEMRRQKLPSLGLYFDMRGTIANGGARDATFANAIRVVERLLSSAVLWTVERNIVRLLCEKTPRATTGERTELIETVIPALAIFEDWEAAFPFVDALVAEFELSAAELGRALVAYCNDLTRRRMDLAAGRAELLNRRATERISTNRILLAVQGSPASSVLPDGEVRVVHLELTTRCNASCPQCPRNKMGGEVIPNLPLTELTLADVQRIMPPAFVARLDKLYACGNYGDAMVASETIEVFEYLRANNPRMCLELHTNGSGRTPEWWRALAALKVEVTFGIDGLADTNHLYRRGTRWGRIMESAAAFIEAGGAADWRFLVFEHNQHQVEEARQLAARMGFRDFQVKRTSRYYSNGQLTDERAVKNRRGEIEYYIRPPTIPELNNSVVVKLRSMNEQEREASLAEGPISCLATRRRAIYISAEGLVFPCCWIGQIYTGSRANGTGELWDLIDSLPNGRASIDGKLVPLEEIISGPLFSRSIPQAWQPRSAGATRLRTCAVHCGPESAHLAQLEDQGATEAL